MHSSVMTRRTSFPFFAMVVTVRHELPAATGATFTTRCALKLLARELSADTGAVMRAAIALTRGCSHNAYHDVDIIDDVCEPLTYKRLRRFL